MTVLPEAGSDGLARATALQRLQLAAVAPAAVVEFESRGRCLVIGEQADALAFVGSLAGGLECCVFVPGDEVTDVDRVDGTLVVRGGRPLIRGALGDFEVALVRPTGTQNLGSLLMPAVERFDVVVDLQATPLLRQAMLPLGYYAPGLDATARAATLEALPQMRGQFEKPKYFNYNPEICAHGRNGKRACTRCIDACPAEAIVSIGNAVVVNPYLCQGGGACATVCPSGAMTYAYPRAGDLLAGLKQLLRDFREAGGVTPSLLLHDETSGVALANGLAESMPEHVLPIALEEVGSAGMDVWLGALAYGAEAVVVLTCDRTPAQIVDALQEQLSIARAILAGMGYREDRLRLVNGDQPVATLQSLANLPAGEVRQPATYVALGDDKRGSLRLALQHLQAHATTSRRVTPLDRGAPFGEVRVDPVACTLCMSCVSACPTHALQDGRGLPQLNFREWNCVQCGLCERTCPEGAITLQPRFLHDAAVRESSRTLHEEQPVCCVACGKPFATRKLLDKLTRKLAGHHMFQSPESRRRLEMCEDCRVRDLFTAEARRPR